MLNSERHNTLSGVLDIRGYEKLQSTTLQFCAAKWQIIPMEFDLLDRTIAAPLRFLSSQNFP